MKWAQWDHLLGTMTDAALAAQSGSSKSAVARRRTKLGIPPYRRHQQTERFRAELDPQLGTAPDRVLAAAHGVSRMTIHRRRYALGIAPFRKHVRLVDEEGRG